MRLFKQLPTYMCLSIYRNFKNIRIGNSDISESPRLPKHSNRAPGTHVCQSYKISNGCGLITPTDLSLYDPQNLQTPAHTRLFVNLTTYQQDAPRNTLHF